MPYNAVHVGSTLEIMTRVCIQISTSARRVWCSVTHTPPAWTYLVGITASVVRVTMTTRCSLQTESPVKVQLSKHTHTHSSQALSMFIHSLTSSSSRHRRVSDGPQHLRQRHRVFQPGRRIRLPLSARAQLHRRLHPRQQGQAQRTDLGPGQWQMLRVLVSGQWEWCIMGRLSSLRSGWVSCESRQGHHSQTAAIRFNWTAHHDKSQAPDCVILRCEGQMHRSHDQALKDVYQQHLLHEVH